MVPNNNLVLTSAAIDGGNTAANAYAFIIPTTVEVIRVGVMPLAGLSGNLHVSFDSLVASTQGAEDIGSVEVPASAAAFAVYYDRVAKGTTLRAGNKVLVQVDNAGDSGENFICQLVLKSLDELEENQSDLTETA